MNSQKTANSEKITYNRDPKKAQPGGKLQE